VARCYNADIIITNKTPVTADVIESAANLQLIAVTATGYNNVDIAAASARNIKVCNVPSYGTYSVAQHVFALLLHLTNHVSMNAASVHAGKWQTAKDWCYSLQPIIELKDKVLGIVGFGRIGKQVAVIAQAFGMKIIYYGGREKLDNTQQVSLHELFIQSDVVSLHCPLTKENKGFVNKELLGLMKPTSFLINTSRGLLINEKDLGLALHQGRLAAAALDVLSTEPPEKNNPLTGLKNCIITPHNAWMSAEARGRSMQVTLENIRAFLKGTPQNVVNG
jgi:glycerate dehydrogenase